MIIMIVCVCVATLAFVGLVIAVILSLRSAVRRLDHVQAVTSELQRESTQLIGELRTVLGSADMTVQSVRQQLSHTEKLFKSAGELGAALEQTANTVQRVSAALSESAVHQVEQAGRKYRRQIGEALEWVEMGYTAWQWVQSKRQSAANNVESTGRDEGHDKDERRES
ncbi:DUF948 domain-containing protein [Paenibacillus tarimensis]